MRRQQLLLAPLSSRTPRTPRGRHFRKRFHKWVPMISFCTAQLSPKPHGSHHSGSPAVPPVPVEAGHVTVSLAPLLLQIMAAELPAAMLLLPSAKAQPLAAVHMGGPPDQAHAACIGSDLKKSGTRCIKLMLPATKDA